MFIQPKILMRLLLPLLLASTLLVAACSSSQPKIDLNEKNPVIYFARTQCFGSCPAYKLTMKGNGTASYEGLANVEKIGYYEATISKDDILELVKGFESIKFFELKDEYDGPVTDIPTRTVTYTLNGKTKSVMDRFQTPQELRDLERRIDEIAEKLSWKKIRDLQEE